MTYMYVSAAYEISSTEIQKISKEKCARVYKCLSNW